jgi:hypothetical protein
MHNPNSGINQIFKENAQVPFKKTRFNLMDHQSPGYQNRENISPNA